MCGDGNDPCIEIHSPVVGRVLRVEEKSERVVAVGSALLVLGDPTALEIVIDVLSTDAVKVSAAATVQIEDWGGERSLLARVRRIEPSGFTKLSALGVEEQRVNVIADFVDAPGPLGDGYRVEARIGVWQGSNLLKIPSSALFRRSGKWSVFVVQQGRARRREVEVGHRSTAEVEVTGGLTDGERVILHPSDLIEDGVRIEVNPR